MHNVPFKSGYLYDEDYEYYIVEGIIDYDSKRIRIEYQIKYPEYPDKSATIHSESIPITEIRKLTFKSRLFSRKLMIEAKSLKYFSSIPLSERGILSIPIQKSSKEDAIRLSNAVNLKISEMNLDRLSGD